MLTVGAVLNIDGDTSSPMVHRGFIILHIFLKHKVLEHLDGVFDNKKFIHLQVTLMHTSHTRGCTVILN